jgi:hypothetical protein
MTRDIDHKSAKPGHHRRISEDPYEEENILHALCVTSHAGHLQISQASRASNLMFAFASWKSLGFEIRTGARVVSIAFRRPLSGRTV